MTKIKKIIIPLGIILVIAIIALIIILNLINKNNQQTDISEDEGIEAYQKETDTIVSQVTNRVDYYTVKSCIGKYYADYSILFNPEIYYIGFSEERVKQEQVDNTQAIYDMLDSQYITEKGITIDNLGTNLKEIEVITPYITNMYVNHRTDNMDIYVIDGTIKTDITEAGEEFQIILKLDILNKTFSIMPSEYVEEKYGNILEGQNLDIELTDSIEKNNNNQFVYRTITEEDYMKDLFAELKNELLYDHEKAYNHLNEEYRNKKFATLEKFNNWATSKEEEYKNMVLAQYQTVQEDGYTQYVLVDQNGKYYIFNETGVMDYTTMLDTYTVDLPEFIEKYNKSNEADKAGMNLQKIVDAINDGDYTYVYNKLDGTFKQNNFKTESDFIAYMKKTFYSNNNVEFSNYRASGDLHVFDATFSDKNNANNQAKSKTFIIQLKEGTDYRLSFNVQ